MKRTILAMAMLGLTAFSEAQPPVLSDLIPFKKGDKWGLIHYADGSEFYKPVFDTIVFRYNEQYKALSVFQMEDGAPVAAVVLNKKKMWLTPDKKLKPADYFLKGFDDKNDIYDDAIDVMVEPDEPANDESITAQEYDPNEGDEFQTVAGRMRVQAVNDTFHFYLNNVEIPEFRALEYNRLSQADGSIRYLVIRSVNNRQYGVVNIERRKFTVRAEYDELVWENKYKGIRALKNTKTGVLDPEGNVILPAKYDNISDGFLTGENRIFSTIDIGNRSFGLVTIKNNIVSESPVRYDWLESVNGPSQILFIAAKNKKTGVVNVKDSVLIPLKYDIISGAASHIDDKRFFVLQSANKLYGFADPDNKFFRVEPKYDRIGEPAPIHFQKNGKTVYIIPVRKNGEFFYIDNYGKEFKM